MYSWPLPNLPAASVVLAQATQNAERRPAATVSAELDASAPGRVVKG
jgi:hypothetical protein